MSLGINDDRIHSWIDLGMHILGRGHSKCKGPEEVFGTIARRAVHWGKMKGQEGRR